MFDSTTSFSLTSLPGTRRPIFLGIPRLSPDGQYVLTYWVRDTRAYAPELGVFDRQGRVVREVTGRSDDNGKRVDSIAWLPAKDRFVYLDDVGINACQLGLREWSVRLPVGRIVLLQIERPRRIRRHRPGRPRRR